jgi:transcriptional regulator with XRE-family HTH domain
VRKPTKAEIGAWLKGAREAARDRAEPGNRGDYAQAEIAHRIGVRERAVRMWEKGRTAPPADKFFALAAFYGANLNALLAERDYVLDTVDASIDVQHSSKRSAAATAKKKRPA